MTGKNPRFFHSFNWYFELSVFEQTVCRPLKSFPGPEGWYPPALKMAESATICREFNLSNSYK